MTDQPTIRPRLTVEDVALILQGLEGLPTPTMDDVERVKDLTNHIRASALRGPFRDEMYRRDLL